MLFTVKINIFTIYTLNIYRKEVNVGRLLDKYMYKNLEREFGGMNPGVPINSKKFISFLCNKFKKGYWLEAVEYIIHNIAESNEKQNGISISDFFHKCKNSYELWERPNNLEAMDSLFSYLDHLFEKHGNGIASTPFLRLEDYYSDIKLSTVFKLAYGPEADINDIASYKGQEYPMTYYYWLLALIIKRKKELAQQLVIEKVFPLFINLKKDRGRYTKEQTDAAAEHIQLFYSELINEQMDNPVYSCTETFIGCLIDMYKYIVRDMSISRRDVQQFCYSILIMLLRLRLYKEAMEFFVEAVDEIDFNDYPIRSLFKNEILGDQLVVKSDYSIFDLINNMTSLNYANIILGRFETLRREVELYTKNQDLYINETHNIIKNILQEIRNHSSLKSFTDEELFEFGHTQVQSGFEDWSIDKTIMNLCRERNVQFHEIIWQYPSFLQVTKIYELLEEDIPALNVIEKDFHMAKLLNVIKGLDGDMAYLLDEAKKFNHFVNDYEFRRIQLKRYLNKDSKFNLSRLRKRMDYLVNQSQYMFYKRKMIDVLYPVLIEKTTDLLFQEMDSVIKKVISDNDYELTDKYNYDTALKSLRKEYTEASIKEGYLELVKSHEDRQKCLRLFEEAGNQLDKIINNNAYKDIKKLLLTGEWIWNKTQKNRNGMNEIEFTYVVAPYLKAVELFLTKRLEGIKRRNRDLPPVQINNRKIEILGRGWPGGITLGSIYHYIKDYDDTRKIPGSSDMVFAYLKEWVNEIRNGYFHKDLLYEYKKVKEIREKTILLLRRLQADLIDPN
jgi:hypothetical protein